MSVFHRSLAVAAILALAGCASTVPLQRGQLNSLSRESEPVAVEQALGKATPTAQFEVTAEGKPYFIRRYLLQTGSRQEMTVMCTPMCIPISYDVPIMTQYLVVQRLPARTMHAWGSVEELSKDQDPDVSGMMPMVKARLEAFDVEKAKKP